MQFTDAISNSGKFTDVYISKRSSQSCKQERVPLLNKRTRFTNPGPVKSLENQEKYVKKAR